MRALVITLATVLALPTPALAATEPADEELFERAKSLYDEGKGKFETADYEAAIETWTEAFTMLPLTPESGRIKALLLYDIASARELAFEVDNEVAHLRQARILLESFEKNIPELYGKGIAADEERTRVRERIASLDAKIAEVEAAQPDDEEPDSGGDGDGRDAADAGSDRGRPLVIAGATLLGIGGASLGLMTGGLVMGVQANDISGLEDDDIDGRRSQFDRGRTGNILAIAGGVAAGVFIVTGTALLVVGKRKSSRRAAMTPLLGPGLAGAAVGGRF